jgi:cytochrome b pre-mRNA-processing protein 3
MSCEGCRTQARNLLRSALRAGVARAPARTFIPAVQTAATASRAPAARYFGNTASRNLLGGSLRGTYQVLGASERLFKVCTKPADYHITEEERRKDLVQKLEDGEEVGNSVDKYNVWHKSKCPFFIYDPLWEGKKDYGKWF